MKGGKPLATAFNVCKASLLSTQVYGVCTIVDEAGRGVHRTQLQHRESRTRVRRTSCHSVAFLLLNASIERRGRQYFNGGSLKHPQFERSNYVIKKCCITLSFEYCSTRLSTPCYFLAEFGLVSHGDRCVYVLRASTRVFNRFVARRFSCSKNDQGREKWTDSTDA